MTLDVEGIIRALPILIAYVVPGYVALWIYSFIVSNRLEQDKYLVIKSVVLSYLIVTVGNCLVAPFKLNILDSIPLKVLTIIISFGLGIVFARLIVSGWFRDFLNKLGVNKSFYRHFWNDVIDTKRGLWVLAFVPREQVIYYGALRNFEEKDDSQNTYLVLSNFIVFSYLGEEIRNYEETDERRVAINSRDISRIELLYDPESIVIRPSSRPTKTDYLRTKWRKLLGCDQCDYMKAAEEMQRQV